MRQADSQQSDPITDVSEVVDIRELTAQADITENIDNEVTSAQAGGARPTTMPAGRKVANLVLAETDLERVGQVYARQMLDGAEVRVFQSWATLVNELAAFQRITKLVWIGHGADSSFIFESEEPRIVPMNEIQKYWNQQNPSRKPTVEEIYLESCHLGSACKSVFTFGRFFLAKKVYGWDCYWHTIVLPINVGGPATEDEIATEVGRIKAILDQYQESPKDTYFLPGTPNARQLLNMGAGDHDLVLEWFRKEFDVGNPPPPISPPHPSANPQDYLNSIEQRSKSWWRRPLTGNLRELHVKTPKACPSKNVIVPETIPIMRMVIELPSDSLPPVGT